MLVSGPIPSRHERTFPEEAVGEGVGAERPSRTTTLPEVMPTLPFRRTGVRQARPSQTWPDVWPACGIATR
jgi:hypothetical protein